MTGRTLISAEDQVAPAPWSVPQRRAQLAAMSHRRDRDGTRPLWGTWQKAGIVALTGLFKRGMPLSR